MNLNIDIPKVSIGMPVFNGESFVRDALNCLLAQSFTDFELIISDNASTDTTEAICREFVQKDPRITYVRQEKNLGVSLNFNFVYKQARGKYFMWAAADDKWDPRFIATLAEVLDVNSDVGLVFSDMYTENLVTHEKLYSSCGFIVTKKKYKRYLFRLLNNSPSIFYGLYRKETLDKFDAVLNFDYADVHLIHWFDLNTSIKIVPLPLYIAGTKGDRVPYSITGSVISSSGLLKAERILLSQHFSWAVSLILHTLVKVLYRKNDRELNRSLKERAARLKKVDNNVKNL